MFYTIYVNIFQLEGFKAITIKARSRGEMNVDTTLEPFVNFKPKHGMAEHNYILFKVNFVNYYLR